MSFLHKAFLSDFQTPLFSIQVFYIIIKGIYVNLYKVRGKQVLYFKQLLCVIVIGIVFNSININKFKIVSFIMYIAAGWTIIFASYEIYMAIGQNGFLLLLFGGISYTLGSILYGLGGKYSVWFHTVFHFFVLAGTILQFISIYLYVI